MSKIKPRGKVPKKASIDEVVEIKTLIRHPMHSGRMKDKDGKKIPKRIININNGIRVTFSPNVRSFKDFTASFVIFLSEEFSNKAGLVPPTECPWKYTLANFLKLSKLKLKV